MTTVVDDVGDGDDGGGRSDGVEFSLYQEEKLLEFEWKSKD